MMKPWERQRMSTIAKTLAALGGLYLLCLSVAPPLEAPRQHVQLLGPPPPPKRSVNAIQGPVAVDSGYGLSSASSTFLRGSAPSRKTVLSRPAPRGETDVAQQLFVYHVDPQFKNPNTTWFYPHRPVRLLVQELEGTFGYCGILRKRGGPRLRLGFTFFEQGVGDRAELEYLPTDACLLGGAPKKKRRVYKVDTTADDYPGFNYMGAGSSARSRAVGEELGYDINLLKSLQSPQAILAQFRRDERSPQEIRKAAAEAARKNPTLFGSGAAEDFGFDHLGDGALARAQEVAKKLGYRYDNLGGLDVNRLLARLKSDDQCINQIVAARLRHR